MKMVPALAALAMMLCGCVSFEYDGVREAEPSASVKMFTDKAKIKQPYQVMGKAVVSGDYMDVSRDRLEEKLLSEAESVGADAVLITSQEVVRSSSGKNTNPLYMSAFDYDDSSRAGAPSTATSILHTATSAERRATRGRSSATAGFSRRSF